MGWHAHIHGWREGLEWGSNAGSLYALDDDGCILQGYAVLDVNESRVLGNPFIVCLCTDRFSYQA